VRYRAVFKNEFAEGSAPHAELAMKFPAAETGHSPLGNKGDYALVTLSSIGLTGGDSNVGNIAQGDKHFGAID